MKKHLLLSLFLVTWALVAQGQNQGDQHLLRGRVLAGSQGKGLPGAYISLEGSERRAVTDAEGEFTLRAAAGDYILIVNFLGYEEYSLEISLPYAERLDIVLQESDLSMDAVDVVSTGYQQLPKERATGSFVQVDNELVNRRISTNLIDRLEDVTPGLIFNRSGQSSDVLSIRGRSTIFANTQPLIVIDNFPYDGPLENINPNDVESITVLRDAAAGSIWGARAGNGVIVITTKRGNFKKGPQVSINANVTTAERPDLFYQQRMSSPDFVDMEELLFGRGFYNTAENSVNRTPLSPVVETLIGRRDGLISEADAARRLDEFRAFDNRRDYMDHLYQTEIRQQYSANVRGGGENQRYALSIGNDRNTESLVGNYLNRLTVSATQDLSMLKGKLNLSTGVYYAETDRESGNDGFGSLRYSGSIPNTYSRLVDPAGNPLPIVSDYREPFKRNAQELGMLDWSLVPLQEINEISNRRKAKDIRLNTNLSYDINSDLKVETLYQYWQNSTNRDEYFSENSYLARNLINRYTQRDDLGNLSYPIPVGGILNAGNTSGESHNVRTQIHYTKAWGDKHDLVALGGFEVKTLRTSGFATRYYGVSEETGMNSPVDYMTLFPQFINQNSRLRIPYIGTISGTADHFISQYANASYTYDRRYTLSGSARRDASNLFGVNANQRAVPLWSIGGAWLISEEDFYGASWLPYLKLRMTYGENGNVDKSISALTTSIIQLTSQLTGLRVGTLMNPPNPDLRWERIKIFNLGLDFDAFDGGLSGSLEAYGKDGVDLIGAVPVAPSNGITQFRGNFASTSTKGFDFNVRYLPVRGNFTWAIDYFHSHVNEKVIGYEAEVTPQVYLNQGIGNLSGQIPAPRQGKPLYAVYSLPSAGLDPQTGDPRGFLDGEISTNYASIINTATLDDLIYHGPGRPTHFGALRNTFSYGGLSVSMNLSYRLGYFYRRTSIRYDDPLLGRVGHGDFADRWQQPGDELVTTVPSLPATRNIQRDNFYGSSSDLVERGDHIRFQDVNITYRMDRNTFPRLPFRGAEIYGYLNNLGMIWKASDDPLDPDFRTMRPLRSMTLGLRIDI
ncbi:SusC/RagA family TonB-linked outer membrane protein [Litoribacter ruber]|uniref:SusC/RagA family TonB-linked outer membrane protein n=1 Tax=Litoribacter ruber TaxID=702568 RepID=UPI001BD982F0|nr:SusC/RagA family TonB-linked outer membrane protein [Litoribacter ruber]MBT0812839.1 SusC/RagA family TonB-linked outer membrane protein [Litoribacter ruber]